MKIIFPIFVFLQLNFFFILNIYCQEIDGSGKMIFIKDQNPDKITDISFDKHIYPSFSKNYFENNSDFLQKDLLSSLDSNEGKVKNYMNSTELDSSYKGINTSRLIVMSTGLLGLGIGFHIYQANAWWKSQRGPFHFEFDWKYAVWMDKIGHFNGGMIGTEVGTAISKWIGFDRSSSIWIGAGFGSAYELYIEVEDGFGKSWGFSPGDATFDVLGAFYPVAQEYWDPLKSINFKMSYLPSSKLNVKDEYGNKTILVDDYQGWSYWLSVNLHDLMSINIQNSWPEYLKWLQLAVGYGLRNYDGNKESISIPYSDRELYISLDYNLMKLLDIDTKFFRTLKESELAWTIVKALDHIHFPAPMLRITFPGTSSTSRTPYVRLFGLFFSNFQ